jgi:hypothetical protein
VSFSHGVTATVTRPPGTDAHGNPLTAPAPHEVPGCAPAPAGSVERHHLEQAVEWDVDLLGPYDANFEPQDMVTLAGDDTEYQVHGTVQRWRHPMTGWEAGSLTKLKAVSG